MQEQNKKILTPLMLTLSLILIIYFGISSYNQFKEGQYIGESENNITISGTGEVYAQPDLALISFSVITEKETVSEAMSENTSKMNNVITEVKNQSVEEKDLKTTNFSVYPRYEWYEATETKPSGERVLVGYEIYQTLEVKVRNLENIGNIIEKATEAGANQVGSLQFTIEDEQEFKNQAREKAINQAKEKAQEIAEQLDIELVKIINFNENTNSPIFYRSYALDEDSGMGGANIETGENKIEVNVNLTYKIK
jgi:hypothetical protein